MEDRQEPVGHWVADADGDMLPPWIALPECDRHCRNAEGYPALFDEWYQRLSDDRKRRYWDKYPPPADWRDWLVLHPDAEQRRQGRAAERYLAYSELTSQLGCCAWYVLAPMIPVGIYWSIFGSNGGPAVWRLITVGLGCGLIFAMLWIDRILRGRLP